MQNARVNSAHKIAWFLDKMGTPSEFWNQVKEGKQDPFEKMIWEEGVQGAGQLSPVGETPELPDDFKLSL